VSLVLQDICHENDWWVARIRVSQIACGFPLCHHLQKAVGHTPAPTREEERVASLGFSSQIGRLNTHLCLVSSFRMRDSLLPLLVSYTDMVWSFGAEVNIFSPVSFVNRKALKKNLSNYYGYINITTADNV
jgi:hypothetical protein